MTKIISAGLYAAWLPVLAAGTGYWAHAAWQRIQRWRA